MRLRLKPNETNGLKVESDIMADKILTLKKSDLVQKIGLITDEEAEKLDTLRLFWMGL